MAMLPAPVNHVLHANSRILDGTSPPTISPHHQDGHTPPSPSLPNTDQQGESTNSVNQSRDPNKRTRRFVCQRCGRKFLRAEHLRRHEITRTLYVEGVS